MSSAAQGEAPPHVRKRVWKRANRLKQLGYTSYVAYLNSPHWESLKARYWRADYVPHHCFCGATRELHLHHKTYERIGAEQLTDLVPLCPICHRMVHLLEWRGDIGLDLVGLVTAPKPPDRLKKKRTRPNRYQRIAPDHKHQMLRLAWEAVSIEEMMELYPLYGRTTIYRLVSRTLKAVQGAPQA